MARSLNQHSRPLGDTNGCCHPGVEFDVVHLDADLIIANESAQFPAKRKD
jgi:hypothetical protein